MLAWFRNPLTTPFGAVFRTELLLNSKRVAPYVLILLFTGHSVLWWGWSAAASFGWATNGDHNIVRNLQGFSFLLGLPIFNAVIMGDPVIRDFRVGIDPLLFSKPVGRASYLFGKFFGNFFVLVCCQSAFVLAMIALQWVPLSGLVVQPARVFPYFKHFFFFVVISHFILAAMYFTIGALTRNDKVAYGLAVAFYPVYISWQLFLNNFVPEAWRQILDPMLLRGVNIPRDKWEDAAWINQIVITYNNDMILNRGMVIVAAALCLLVLYRRFSMVQLTQQSSGFSLLNLSSPAETVQYDREIVERPTFVPATFTAALPESTRLVALPQLATANDGFHPTIRQLFAAVRVELQLLRSEKSLFVLVPLTMLLSFVALPFSATATKASASIDFASSTAQGLLLFLLGVIVFYTGEAVYRERELRVEPLLWSAPAPNSVFLISKVMATLLLVLFLVLLVGVTAIVTQILRNQTPIDVLAYLTVYGVILVPSLIFMTSACFALNVLLREKYLSYAVIIGISSGLFYLYTQGYHHWFYNPVLYGLWTEADVQHPAEGVARLIALRGYTLALALLCIFIAHLFFARPTSRFSKVSRSLAD